MDTDDTTAGLHRFVHVEVRNAAREATEAALTIEDLLDCLTGHDGELNDAMARTAMTRLRAAIAHIDRARYMDDTIALRERGPVML